MGLLRHKDFKPLLSKVESDCAWAKGSVRAVEGSSGEGVLQSHKSTVTCSQAVLSLLSYLANKPETQSQDSASLLILKGQKCLLSLLFFFCQLMTRGFIFRRGCVSRGLQNSWCELINFIIWTELRIKVIWSFLITVKNHIWQDLSTIHDKT